jgi:hypothetical protein
MFIRARRFGISALAVLSLAFAASPAAAQDAAPVVVVTGGIDFVNQYNFRGIRQNTEGVSVWPFVDFAFAPFKDGQGALKTVTLNLGTWNAIHSQISDGNKLYETDFYGTLGFGFSKAALAFTYTSYTSPADLFAHVKELAVKASFDDSAALGSAALKPYALVAFEMDNQADAGASEGTYVELGIAPGYAGSRASLAIPVKVGLSGGDYYEFGSGEDSAFGYFSVGGIVTVPMGSHANIHGGVEFQAFGDNVKAYNGQDTAGIASIGLGFAF